MVMTLSSCDWGLQGPGLLSGVLRAGPIPLGAVVLEIRGSGIEGFSGAGQTRVFHAEPEPDVHRVALINSAPGQFDFSVVVQDVSAPLPTVIPLQAVDGENEPMANLATISVNIFRGPGRLSIGSPAEPCVQLRSHGEYAHDDFDRTLNGALPWIRLGGVFSGLVHCYPERVQERRLTL